MKRSVLVTGASGKVGRHLIPALRAAGCEVRALKHHSPLACQQDIEILQGSIADAAFVRKAVNGMNAIIHLATCKEDAEQFVDVSIRGTLNILEAARTAVCKPLVILASGDAALGIYFYPQPAPLDENAPLTAYPGCYALSKVMEETLVRQYGIQYGVAYTILRFSWIQDEDDLLAHMTVQPPDFGVPIWQKLANTREQQLLFVEKRNATANLIHPGGASYKRHVVDIEDVVDALLRTLDTDAAIGGTFNIAAPAPFTYEALSAYVAERLDLPVVTFEQDGFHDFEIDVSRARTVLGFSPQRDAFAMIDRGIDFRKAGGARSIAMYRG